ncbi:hypothetical protein [Xylella fastidiosa]|uniref:hypothetical protein n=1 Tax=Xylella fastidiosa TaxID=2371 RepID=UPI000765FB9A|nr:hypothetical protein [Xylella fastidiosa]ALR02541.1 hypothetical protein OY18_10405 [Xylella fastidiosa]KXB13391.1 hypothetical protein ADT29_08075 [Xylella fastidiosa]KXB21216.1 hypothetical protein ADT28_05520 [Xylella fastidiosa]MDG5823621.1 hypothetical protein [Xylella fastidiosa subsp. pauca]MDG5825109.1 hypothetical protein [Xylella fastidiosa subsp. pauca]
MQVYAHFSRVGEHLDSAIQSVRGRSTREALEPGQEVPGTEPELAEQVDLFRAKPHRAGALLRR